MMVSAIQGAASVDAGGSRPADRAAARARPGARLAAPDGRRRRGGRCDRHARRRGRRGGHRLRDLDFRQGPGAARASRDQARQHDEQRDARRGGSAREIRRPRRSGAGPSGAHRRRRGQRSGGAEGRTEDGGKMAHAVRHARCRDRARRRSCRRRRRESARDPRLAAAGQAAPDGENRLRARCTRLPISRCKLRMPNG